MVAALRAQWSTNMSDKTEIDDVFNDSKPIETEVEQTEVEIDDEEKGETELNEDSEEEVESPATENQSDDLSGKSHVPVKAVLEERRKRQELEAKLKQYEERQPSGEQSADLAPEVQKEIVKIRRETSVNLVKTIKTDYEEKEKIFIELAKSNPSLINEMDASGNPALFAYDKASEHLELQEIKALKETPEWKEFIDAKKSGKLESPQTKRNKSALSMPNLNKVASAKPSNSASEDDVFSGAAF